MILDDGTVTHSFTQMESLRSAPVQCSRALRQILNLGEKMRTVGSGVVAVAQLESDEVKI